MKKCFVSLLFLSGIIFTVFTTPASQAGTSVYVNLGPYGAIGYPSAYPYPVNNGYCGAGTCVYPTSNYYPPVYYNNPYSYNNQALNNPYVFDTVNSPWASNAGRIVPIRMSPRNPYGY